MMMRLVPLLTMLLLARQSVQAPAAPVLRVQSPRTYANSSGERALPPLTFDEHGTFQLSIFGDLHFGENAWDQWGPQQDLASLNVMRAVLDAESPQLVVLNGDLITGENAYLENSTSYIDRIVSPLVARGLSWASTYGNHDHNFNLSARDMLAREKRFPGSRTRSMVQGRSAGVTNYYLLVFGPECGHDTGARCAPELILWFFDSRGGHYYRKRTPDGRQVGQPDWVDTSVVDWFRQTNAEMRASYGRTIPSLAFVHIPTNASLALQQDGQGGIDPNHQPGVNDDSPLAQQGQGWCPDGRDDGTCEYGAQDVPFMHALATTPGLIALFSGHDHGDSWCSKWDRLVPGMTVAGNGVNLCFGGHSGYGGYGNWIRGARQVRLSRKKLWEAETWIRRESGSAVGKVTLNTTYGKDWYPAVPNDRTSCPTCDYTKITPGPRGRSPRGPG